MNTVIQYSNTVEDGGSWAAVREGQRDTGKHNQDRAEKQHRQMRNNRGKHKVGQHTRGPGYKIQPEIYYQVQAMLLRLKATHDGEQNRTDDWHVVGE